MKPFLEYLLPPCIFLATWPIVFAGYDLYCYRKRLEKLSPHFRRIALLNVLYCFLSFGTALYHLEVITIYGWIYLLLEIGLVGILASIEFSMAVRLKAMEEQK